MDMAQTAEFWVGIGIGLIPVLGALYVFVSRYKKLLRQKELIALSREDVISESMIRTEEMHALIKASQAVLKCNDFTVAAEHIFTACKELLGASAGYVALLNDYGTENEIVYLDSGFMTCSVDQDLPMPIRGFREMVYKRKQPMYDNDFGSSEWMKLLPAGHVKLNNVLFAPLVVDGRVVGLLGLGNKPSGFSHHDAKIAGAFGEIAAIALVNFKTLASLHENQEYLKSVQNDLEVRVRQRTNALLISNQQLLNEIHEHKMADEKVASRLRYESGLAGFAKCLLGGFKSSKVLEDALRNLLSAIQVGRVYIRQVEYGEGEHLSVKNICGASDAGVSRFPAGEINSCLLWPEEFRCWLNELESGQYVTSTVDDLTEDQRKVFEQWGIASSLMLPIHMNGQWYGVFGFDDQSDHRRWSAEDIQLLRTAADLVTIYLSRIQTLGELLAYQNKLRSLASKLTQTEERERQRIAEGLHDEIIQPLIFLKIRLDMLRNETENAETANACREMMDVIQKLTAETRQFTFELSCPVLYEVGLAAALEEFLQLEVCEKHGIVTEFQYNDEDLQIDHDMSVFLYKAARELLTNIIKHAEAGVVKVTLANKEGVIELSVEDDGVGFEVPKGHVDDNRPGGFGLFSVRERISHLGGDLTIDTAPDEGTKVTMTAPTNIKLSKIGELE